MSLTPPMGWNSWYVHMEGDSEKAIREMAEAMNEKGLYQYGCTYLPGMLGHGTQSRGRLQQTVYAGGGWTQNSFGLVRLFYQLNHYY